MGTRKKERSTTPCLTLPRQSRTSCVIKTKLNWLGCSCRMNLTRSWQPLKQHRTPETIHPAIWTFWAAKQKFAMRTLKGKSLKTEKPRADRSNPKAVMAGICKFLVSVLTSIGPSAVATFVHRMIGTCIVLCRMVRKTTYLTAPHTGI